MKAAGGRPFDVFLEEVRRHFWNSPRVHQGANTLSVVAYQVLACAEAHNQPSDQRVLQLLTDLILHHDPWKVHVPQEEFSGDTLRERIQDVVIGAAVFLLRLDESIRREDTIRQVFADRPSVGDQILGPSKFLGSN